MSSPFLLPDPTSLVQSPIPKLIQPACFSFNLDIPFIALPDSPSESSRSPSPLQVVQETEHIRELTLRLAERPLSLASLAALTLIPTPAGLPELTKVTRSNNKRGLNGHKLQRKSSSPPGTEASQAPTSTIDAKRTLTSRSTAPLDDEMKEVLFSCWNRGVTKWHYCNQELNRICGRSYSYVSLFSPLRSRSSPSSARLHLGQADTRTLLLDAYRSDGSYKRALQAAKIGPRISQLSLAQVEQFVVLAMAGDLAGATGIRGMMHKLRSDGRIVTR